METSPSGPLPLPDGAEVLAASGKGLTLSCPGELPRMGAILAFDLLLGARPLPVMARVVDWRVAAAGAPQALELEFVALAQVDRDTLVDFVQAVGHSTLRVRKSREG